MPITFAVNNVEPEFLDKHQAASTAVDVVKNARKDPIYIGEFLASSFGNRPDSPPRADTNGRAVTPSVNGLIHTVITAYNKHHHLSIRPDDIWLCILSQLSYFVTAHAEEMRHLFVSHDGKKQLEVVRDGSRFRDDWDGIIDEFNEQMKKHLKDADIQDWLTPAFTTTTATDVVAARISVMAIMAKYFDYAFRATCGLPSVTLEGERQDWVELKRKAERLTAFGMEELTRWHTVLTPIFDNCIGVFDGRIDVDGFWRRMAHYDDRMSGGPFVSGWIGVSGRV